MPGLVLLEDGSSLALEAGGSVALENYVPADYIVDGFIPGASTVNAPAVAPGPVAVAGLHIASTMALHAPGAQVGTVAVLAPHIASTVALHAPAAVFGSSVPFIFGAAVAHAPAVSAFIGANSINLATVFSPSLAALIGALRPASARLYSQRVALVGLPSELTILRELAAWITSRTGRPCFIAKPDAGAVTPYVVLQVLPAHRYTPSLTRKERLLRITVQVDAVGRATLDSTWMLDQAAAATRQFRSTKAAATTTWPVTGVSDVAVADAEIMFVLAQAWAVDCASL